MFDEEREMWEKFFGYFKKKFGEEVGILPGAFEDDDIEVDMIIGESTKLVRGIRVFQLLEDDEAFDSDEDDDNVEPDTDDDEDIEDDGDDDDVDGDDDDDDDDDDEDEDFDDDDQGIWVYDLIYTKDGKQTGKLAVELDFPEPEKVEDEDELEEGSHCKACEEGEGEHNHPTEETSPEDEKIWITMEIYTEEGNLDDKITCAVVIYKETNEKHVFIETNDFPEM